MVDSTSPNIEGFAQDAQTGPAIEQAAMAAAAAPGDPAPDPTAFMQTNGPGGLAVEQAPNSRPDVSTLEMMLDLPLDVTVELGRTAMQLGEALALRPGAIIELDRLPGEPLDMHVNDRLVARGEVVVINDALGLRITEIIGKSGEGPA